MSSDEIAIRVDSLGKCYEIYDRPQDRLKQSVVPRIRRSLGWPASSYFRAFWALRDVSFDVRRGETIGIIGRNGSGKSTLLQIICGTLTPTTGSVQTSGRVAALLELGAGFNPEFTGRENVYLNGSVLGLSRAELDERFDAITDFADIGQFIDQPVKTYSSGMYVRLAFAVIAHVDADVLVIDEALAVGDIFFTQKCMRFLRKFMERGTVIFVSHDTAAVQNLCNRAIWLEHGSVRFTGSAKDVAAGYLESLYESQQDVRTIAGLTVERPRIDSPVHVRDMRLDFINTTQFRNDIEIFQFDPDAQAFGQAGGYIESVTLLDSDGNRLSWVVGGEDVTLQIRFIAITDIHRPIVGFYLKDRLGQTLFGDNTYLTYCRDRLDIGAGREAIAKFRFHMPVLPAGDYSVTAALAEGTQQEHVQHHWLHDAIALKSHSTSACQGLMGIPMKMIQIVRAG